MPVADHVVAYARDVVRATRPKEADAPKFVKEMVAWGAGPRAGISLIIAAKARAVLHGRYHATTEDVRAIALPVLRHRVVTTFNAEAAGATSDQFVQMILDHIKPTTATNAPAKIRCHARSQSRTTCGCCPPKRSAVCGGST